LLWRQSRAEANTLSGFAQLGVASQDAYLILARERQELLTAEIRLGETDPACRVFTIRHVISSA
jgi:hypothetical protein